jgi:hypothetical protein
MSLLWFVLEYEFCSQAISGNPVSCTTLDTLVQGLLALGGSLQEARKDGIAILVFSRKSVRLFQCVFSPALSEASLITAF